MGLLNRKRKLSITVLAALVIAALVLVFFLNLSFRSANADVMTNYSYRRPVTLENTATSKSFQVDTNGTLTSSLVAYYPMQGNSQDFFSSNNGSDSSMTYGTSYGKISQGASFNGSGSYIQTPNLSAINSNSQPYSFEVWFKATAAGVIVDETGSTSINAGWHQDFIEILSSGNVMVRVYSLTAVTAGTASFNTWNQVILTYDGTTVRSYLNGVAGGTTTGTRSSPGASGYSEYINFGATDTTNMGSGAWFNGSMDEIGIWSKTLSAQEISDLYNSGNGQTMVLSGTTLTNSSVLIQNPVYNDTGLVGSWHMEGNSNDSSGNADNGSDLNMAYGTSYGKVGQGANFNGSSSYINIPNSTAFDVSNYTIAAWVYSTNYSQDMFIFEKGPVNTQYSLFFESGSVVQRSYNSSGGLFINQYTTLANAGISNSNWYYIVSTYNGSLINLYVNGVLKSSVAVSGALQTGQSGERIGAYGGSSPSYYFNGDIDEVRVYGRALSSTEVTGLYQAHAALNYQDVRFVDSNGTTFLSYYRPTDGKFWVTVPSIPFGTKTIYVVYGNATDTDSSYQSNAPTGLVGDWNMDEPTVGTVHDSSGNNNNGTETATAVVSGEINNARSFNGSSSYIQMSSPVVSSGTAMSVSLWVWNNSATQSQDVTIFTNQNDTGNYGMILSRTTSGTSNAWSVFFGGGNGSWYGYGSNTFSIPVGVWTHLVCIVNGTTIQVYQNGIPIVNYSPGSVNPSFTSSHNLELGSDTYGASGRFFNGYIDDVRIYNTALSATQAKGLYSYTSATLVLPEDPINPITVTSASPSVGSPSGGTNVTVGGTGFFNAYQRPITITNGGGSVLTDYQVQVTTPIYNETGLLGSWHMEGNSQDSSGNNNNGTDTSVTYSTSSGEFGQGASFNGSTSSILTPKIPLTGSFTIAAWVKIPSSLGANYNTIVYKGTSGSAVNQNYSFIIRTSTSKLEFYMGNGSTYNSVLGNTALSIGSWYHVAVTFDGSALRLYVNGSLDNSTTTTITPTDQGTNTQIGMAIDTGVTPNGGPMNGYIDEVRIYNRTLSSTEITGLYQAHAADNYQNVRFFDADGITPLSYWMQQDGVFWVRVPSIPAAGKTIYVKYGSPNMTSASNGNNTFVMFDDFKGNQIDTTKWVTQILAGSITEANGYLAVVRNGSNTNTIQTLDGISIPNYVVDFSAAASSVASNIQLGIMDANQADGNGYYPFFTTGNAFNIYKRTSGTWTLLQSSVGSYTPGAFANYETVKNGSNFSFYSNGTQVGSTQSIAVGGTTYILAPRVWNESPGEGGTLDLYNFRVRQYASTQPTTSVGAEVAAPPSVSFGSNTATTTTFNSSNSVSAITPAGSAGAVNVSVTNPDGTLGTLSNGFVYGNVNSGVLMLFD